MRGAAAVIAHTDAETRADSSDAETRRRELLCRKVEHLEQSCKGLPEKAKHFQKNVPLQYHLPTQFFFITTRSPWRRRRPHARHAAST